MRKLKLQVQMTVDGFVARPDGALDWMTWNLDEKLIQFIGDLHTTVDSILLGRKMTGGFNSYWESVSKNPESPEYTFGTLLHEMPKFVFTKTLSESDPEVKAWHKTSLIKGDLVEEVNKLKNQEGKDLIVYGGAEFVSNLVRNNLIDEYFLFINPTAIGSGLKIFDKVGESFKLTLVKATPYSCGVTVLNYKPA